MEAVITRGAGLIQHALPQISREVPASDWTNCLLMYVKNIARYIQES
jgi:hypothetical protein